jgi:murein DD-endopeptidase MepM/ murein hydrolase activator NlpD
MCNALLAMSLRSFLARILTDRARLSTLLFVPENRMEEPEQYGYRPSHLRLLLASVVILLVVGTALVTSWTSIADWIRGQSMQELREEAVANAQRVSRLEDSLSVQVEYIQLLSSLIHGSEPEPGPSDTRGQPGEYTMQENPLQGGPPSPEWSDHEQPALALDQMPAFAFVSTSPEEAARPFLSGLRLPFPLPVDGFITRGFNPQRGHFGIDIAVDEGTFVRSVGEGHVVVADWTYDGGYVIAVQHTDGYVTIYKHNGRLLKRVGDRVLDREAIAISGNSGELTTGPHIHLELWHEGLAQDPQQFLIQ